MAASLALLILAVAYVAIPFGYRRLQRFHLQRLCRAHRVVAITFDDGPGRQLTPVVLDRLADAGACATFFALGRAIAGNEHLVTTMQACGHEIGSHGHDHVDHLKSWPWQGIHDTRRALLRLEDLLGRARGTVTFRPPHGRLNLLSLLYVLSRRTPIAGWTHDSCDTRLSVDVPPRETVDQLRRSGGGVVLLHDFDRAIPNPAARVLARLEAILQLRREGFRFVRFSELEVLRRGGALARTPIEPAAELALSGDPRQRRMLRGERRRG
jgi:peptidoglycan-N-acetylglucosamine deacetylase